MQIYNYFSACASQVHSHHLSIARSHESHKEQQALASWFVRKSRGTKVNDMNSFAILQGGEQHEILLDQAAMAEEAVCKYFSSD
ncbi:hypothetical protein V6N13_078297 [Hibiscus sabdariffa]